MNQSNELVQMVGLLPAYIEPTSFNFPILIIAIVLVTIGIAYFIKKPFLYLSWKIKTDKITTRNAAHYLAKKLTKKKSSFNCLKLNALRFNRGNPTKNQLLNIIKVIHNNG